MAPIRQDLETTRRELDDKFRLIARYLMLAGLLPAEIKERNACGSGSGRIQPLSQETCALVPGKAAARDAARRTTHLMMSAAAPT